ncbi:MAG: response regulator transcription factor [Candidatus Hadarchaeaceae archaeon]
MKKKIMVVDDSREIVKVIQKILESENFAVTTAYSGAECLNKLKKEAPDLILLDLLMPGMGGINVLRELMRRDPKAKVVMLTVMGQVSIVNECSQLGAKDFITKPFDNEDLIRRVKWILRGGNA